MSRYVDISICLGSKRIRVNNLIYVAAVAFTVIFAVAVFFGKGSVGRPMRYIIHAGGQIDAGGQMLSYTNSLEALENCYDNSNKFCEIDLMEDDDGSIICAHDKETASQFEGVLTLMSMDDLAGFMREHRDLSIVTDVKSDNVGVCRTISEMYPDLRDNLIVQIYHKDEYEPVRELGFSRIIYTLYNEGEDALEPESLEEFVSTSKLTGVTFWETFPEERQEAFETLKRLHVPLFVHTINDRDEMERFIGMGITGIYTDMVNASDRY